MGPPPNGGCPGGPSPDDGGGEEAGPAPGWGTIDCVMISGGSSEPCGDSGP